MFTNESDNRRYVNTTSNVNNGTVAIEHYIDLRIPIDNDIYSSVLQIKMLAMARL